MPDSNTPRALSALFDEHNIQRHGWRNKFHLAATTYDGRPGGEVGELVIVRVNADGSEWPWTPTEDDLFATDWQFATDGCPFLPGAPDRTEGDDFSDALHALQSGGSALIGAGPLRLEQGTLPPDLGGGPCIVLVLPSGQRRIWRPQHQDLWGVYTITASAGV